MQKTLFRIHLYAGLFCAGYMIIFGFSSLQFNHKFAFVDSEGETVSWERPIEVENNGDDLLYAQNIRDKLGLMGWTPSWEFKRDSENGDFNFTLVRPGKQYQIKLVQQSNLAQVEQTRQGFWKTLVSLHALGVFPNAGFSRLWPIYTEICVWTVLFAAASGVYFWQKRRVERVVGWVMLSGVAGGSLLLMLYVWFWG
ncbi:hypothetical protein ACFL5K_04170 [Gemmatimonadota bacterium]